MDFEVIWERAKPDLVLPTGRGGHDVTLAERAYRLGRTAELLLKLPEVQRFAVDHRAVLVAAVYLSAGAADLCRGGADRIKALSIGLFDTAIESAIRAMHQRLHDLIPRMSLQLAERILHAVGDRATTQVAAQVVADAEQLQEFGVLSLWPTIRRGILDGKGVQALLDSWQRKREYRFWEARLNEAFHFAGSRQIARMRLSKLDRFVSELEEEHDVSDVAELLPTPRLHSAMTG